MHDGGKDYGLRKKCHKVRKKDRKIREKDRKIRKKDRYKPLWACAVLALCVAYSGRLRGRVYFTMTFCPPTT